MSSNRPANNQQPTTNNQQPTTNNQQPTTNNQPPTTNHQQPTTNNQPPTTNHQPPTTNNQQPTTNHQQPTTNNQPPTTNHQQPTTNHQPPTTNHQPPTTNHQPPTTNHQTTTTTTTTTTTATVKMLPEIPKKNSFFQSPRFSQGDIGEGSESIKYNESPGDSILARAQYHETEAWEAFVLGGIYRRSKVGNDWKWLVPNHPLQLRCFAMAQWGAVFTFDFSPIVLGGQKRRPAQHDHHSPNSGPSFNSPFNPGLFLETWKRDMLGAINVYWGYQTSGSRGKSSVPVRFP